MSESDVFGRFRTLIMIIEKEQQMTETQPKLGTMVYRKTRPHLSCRVHNDIMLILRKTAKAQGWTISKTVDELVARGAQEAGILPAD